MKLQSLKSFEKLNEESLSFVCGGTSIAADESKKKDVTSTSQDSVSNDH